MSSVNLRRRLENKKSGNLQDIKNKKLLFFGGGFASNYDSSNTNLMSTNGDGSFKPLLSSNKVALK